MEKVWKPVPECEALKYKGTPNKPDIKIFVSHRIDLDSETIDNPLYVNVRCGAIFDERDNIKILGDDTGDNISEKREHLCEYTVQYWAWKNVEADYYGLCHYRRYLSFSDKVFPEWNEQRFVAEGNLSRKKIEKYGLLDSRIMRNEIRKYDVITSVTYETSNINIIPKAYTVRDLFIQHPGLLTCAEDIQIMTDIVEKSFPQYFQALLEELESSLHRGFNCFVMRKELFQQMCEFEFGVLFELERRFCSRNQSVTSERELGYLGEILYGAFIRWVQTETSNKVKETQILLLLDTRPQPIKFSLYERSKRFLTKVFPTYRCSLRIEQKIIQQQAMINNLNSTVALLSNEVRRLNQREVNTFWMQAKQYSSNMDLIKKEFWENYPAAQGDLRVVQLANASLLKSLKKICEHEGLKFWMHGRSLIGALRHKGFVPWDDDIDIAMMREDFLRLRECLTSHKIFEIADYYYIALGTRSYRFRRHDIDSNCFVDIFVYDHYEILYNDALKDWESLTRYKLHLAHLSVTLCREKKMFPTEPRLQDFPELKEELDQLIERYIKRIQGSAISDSLVWGIDNNYEDARAYAWKHGRIFYFNDIFPLQEALFEGELFYIPNNFEKYAFAEYGIQYLEMPKNMGESIHWQQFFSTQEQIELAKQIIQESEEECLD